MTQGFTRASSGLRDGDRDGNRGMKAGRDRGGEPRREGMEVEPRGAEMERWLIQDKILRSRIKNPQGHLTLYICTKVGGEQNPGDQAAGSAGLG